jgi:hypothetical protein
MVAFSCERDENNVVSVRHQRFEELVGEATHEARRFARGWEIGWEWLLDVDTLAGRTFIYGGAVLVSAHTQHGPCEPQTCADVTVDDDSEFANIAGIFKLDREVNESVQLASVTSQRPFVDHRTGGGGDRGSQQGERNQPRGVGAR